MKKTLLMFLISFVLILGACSKNESKIVNIDRSNDKRYENYKDVYYSINKGDLEILKLAFNKGEKYCSYSRNKKECFDILHNQKKYFSNLTCEKLLIYKDKCFNKKYLKTKECEKITNIYLKKQCIFNRKYNDAIKNKDESFCNRLPRIKQKECFEKIK